MKVVELDLDGPRLPLEAGGAVVTVGTFDGVHLGHRQVLAEIVRRARSSHRSSVLVTFEPHPLRIVRPDDAPPLLSTLDEKVPLLATSGLDLVCVLPFTRTLQAYSARRFVTEILLERVGMRELVMGYDHGFGRGREGSVETMRGLGTELDFGVDVVEAVVIEGEAVSSTRIRARLAEGDVVGGARLLGRPYGLEGIVETGAQRGRLLGFPTANLRIDHAEKMLPLPGIYAAYGVLDDRRQPGLLHVGPRPTFPGDSPTVELHLLDWSGDLYGSKLGVEICARLRDVIAYESVDDLVAQMHQDAADGRAVLEGRGADTACAQRDSRL